MLLPYYQEGGWEAGIDEAGRGCYAGPVCAAAVILPHDFHHPLLNDSKQLSEKHRDQLRPVIEENSIAFGVGFCDHDTIDRINILQATYLAMHRALEKLTEKPERLLIDGNRFKPYKGIPHHCFVKGDGRFASIAAASILAKTYRDAYMKQLHEEYPGYGWDRNKGYGTSEHRDAISRLGLCKYHRKSFNIVPGQRSLFEM